MRECGFVLMFSKTKEGFVTRSTPQPPRVKRRLERRLDAIDRSLTAAAPLSRELMDRVRALTEGVEIDLSAPLGAEDSESLH